MRTPTTGLTPPTTANSDTLPASGTAPQRVRPGWRPLPCGGTRHARKSRRDGNSAELPPSRKFDRTNAAAGWGGSLRRLVSADQGAADRLLPGATLAVGPLAE